MLIMGLTSLKKEIKTYFIQEPMKTLKVNYNKDQLPDNCFHHAVYIQYKFQKFRFL